MVDEKGFIDQKFKKGIYGAIKNFDPELTLNLATFSEKNAVEISQGKETGKRENLETTVEFQKENVFLEVVKGDADDSFIEMTLNIGDDEIFFTSIGGDGSVFMEYDDGYIFFPKMSIRGYFFSKNTIENYKMITGDNFNYGKFAEYLKSEFPKSHIKPDDIIISKGINLQSKLQAVFSYIKPTYENINNQNQLF